MASAKLMEQLAPRIQSIRIVWTAMTVTLGLFGGIAYVVCRDRAPATDLPPILPVFFPVVGLSTALSAFGIRRTMLSEQQLRPTIEAATPHDGLDRFEAGVVAVMPKFLSATIVALALHEAIAILGLVRAVIEARWEQSIPFLLAALVLNILAFPRLGPLLDRLWRFKPGNESR